MKQKWENSNYYVFEDNQVLSSANLNQIVNYLDEQERLSRANLIGIGIVCGLEIDLKESTSGTVTIHLSKGCGVTSEGYLIVEPDDVELVSYRKYSDESHYKPFSTLSADVLELFPENAEGTELLTGDFLKDKAVLLFLELKEESLRNCNPGSCDNLGGKITVKVRRLLIDHEDLMTINDYTLDDYQKLCTILPEVPMRRLVFLTQDDLRFHQDVYRNFFLQQLDGKTVIERLSEAIVLAYKTTKKLVSDLIDFDGDNLASFFTFSPDAKAVSIQYHYDFLRDLTAAYHELRVALLEQPAICLPNDNFFPQHLVLGLPVSISIEERLTGRTAYYPSPASGHLQPDLKKIRFLFNRINQLIWNFNIPLAETTALRITPSLYGSNFLSGKALPFYYKHESREHWDITKSGKEKSKEILSWHKDDDSPSHIRDPLLYDLESYNFFRIEGIIGRNIIKVSSELAEQLKANRLPFSILHVNADKIGSFLDKHYAIDHESGVMRGGTFVVIHRDTGAQANLVTADFALPYRIEEKEGAYLGRVLVNECDYEWFDSRKHVSNLIRREYRFPSRYSEAKEYEKKTLAAYYVVIIYCYEIQGRTLLNNGPIRIKVPLAEFIKDHLSSIANRLNAQFPAGLIFDHKQNTNKLHIRYFSDHKFRIELGGLQGNQIRYAYTPDGIYRWQKHTWESLEHISRFKVTCRLCNDYRADEYRWLQEDNYYSADYPAATSLPTASELIKWENMIKQRAPKEIDDLPIKDILRRIKKEIDENYNVGTPQVTAVLVGSWANGSWVCRGWGKERYPDVFFDLRKKITAKDTFYISGRGMFEYSDIDLLIEIAGDTPSANELVSLLKTVSDGYDINIVLGKKDSQNGLPL